MAHADPVTADGMDLLDAVDQTIAAARLEGLTWAEAGERAGISKSSAFRRGSKPEVKAVIRQQGADVVEAARQRLVASTALATAALLEIVQDPEHPQRLAAVKELLRRTMGEPVQHTEVSIAGQDPMDLVDRILGDE